MAEYNSAYTGEQIDEAIGQVPHKADTTLSNLTDNATALYNLGAASNPNLLDNWYFADPIDQRQGYVVPPGVATYRDPELSNPFNAVTAGYRTVTELTSTYARFTGDDGVTIGYVPASAAVRGYSNYGDSGRSIHSIDRWRADSNVPAVLIQEDGLLMVRPSSQGWILQMLPQKPEYFVNKTVTLSVLLGDGTLCHTTAKFESEDPVVLDTKFDRVTLRWQISYASVVQFVLYALSLGDVKVVAAKLELGSQQTLAHQDADGNWVLNDQPPNRALELAKCQRYQVVLSGTGSPMAYIFFGRTNAGDQKMVTFVIPLNVTMRSNPAIADFAAKKITVTNIRTGERTEGTLNQYGAALENWVQLGATIDKEWGSAVPCMGEFPYTYLPLILDSNL